VSSALLHLKQRSEFLLAAKYGRHWATPGLVLQARPHDGNDQQSVAPTIRVGFTVSRKVGNAVKRNRARRRLRAAVQDIFPCCAEKGCDYVVIGRTGTLKRPFLDLIGDLRTALNRTGRLLKKSSA